MKKIGLLLSAVGPGLFLIGYNIGTGSVTTMAETGSKYGMSLFWVLFLSCLFTFVMLVAYGRFTLVSGETAMTAYKNHLPLGRFLAIYTMIALIIGELAALAGIMGIVASLVNEWTRFLFGGDGANVILVATVVIAGCYYLLWVGKYTLFEKFLTVLVTLMGASFMVSMFIVVDTPSEFITGLVPGIPEGKGAFINVAAIAGTTCSAMVFIMRSIVVAEKGWKMENLGQEKVDALVSAGMMLLLSAAVMACAAGAIFHKGLEPVTRAVDMVRTLEPMAGKYAISIFVVGIIGAGVSTLFPIALVAPWLICDYRGTPRNIRSPLFRWLGGLGLLLGLTVPIFKFRPVWVMIASQAFQATILPAITAAVFFLLNDRRLMGEHKAGWLLNTGLAATFAFAVFTSLPGVIDLAGALMEQATGFGVLGRVVIIAVGAVAGAIPCIWIITAIIKTIGRAGLSRS
ncbi:MAG: Nramp family divalent metal transporter [Candidatus Glassbacteria bacterium]|nr:Nramp family divalent metal transporter [Candidatus Glassbacteria bacterium]